MSRIILIETSTALCSVALCENGAVLAERQSANIKDQAAMTAPFVQQVLADNGLSVKDCDAVCVSSGPGSYTGLRVGVSTAKGLCFATGLPLISVCTIDVLAEQALTENLVPEGCRYIVPMIDARRMEVYAAVCGADGKRPDEVRPVVVDAGSYSDILAEGKVLFIGDGALKCSDIIKSDNAVFVQTNPRASAMCRRATEAFAAGIFENTAYFEPFYLKQFTATVSRKKLF